MILDNTHKLLAYEITWLHAEKDRIDEQLATTGPEVLAAAIERHGSLRAVGRAAGLSPTYLSQVNTGKLVISRDAYLKLYRLV